MQLFYGILIGMAIWQVVAIILFSIDEDNMIFKNILGGPPLLILYILFYPDIRGRHQIIMAVHKFVPVCPHIGINQVEHAVVIGKTGGKHSAGGVITLHVQLGDTVQRPGRQLPVL